MYYLMVKTHNKTGLKYLCITKRENWEEYSGSGIYWNNHLKKHGFDFSTELLYESDDYDGFLQQCLYYSDLYDVARSKDFANVVPETGYNTCEGASNLELWWKYASEEAKDEVISKRSVSIKRNHWIHSDQAEDIQKRVVASNVEYWKRFTPDERREMTECFRDASLEFFKNKETPEYIAYVKNQSEVMKRVFTALPEGVLSERNRQHRLNISKESAESRKIKIREVYASGKHDEYFKRVSNERVGVGNPHAKIIVWYGVQYTKSQFKIFLNENNITYGDACDILDNHSRIDCYRDYEDETKTYPEITCPYCNKKSINKPSSFKRWHFDNCKMKKD